MAPEYEILNPETVPAYIAKTDGLNDIVDTSTLEVSEVGDGNLNLVFVCKDGNGNGICLKQSLPYVRLVGEGWPLTPERVVAEARGLKAAVDHVPDLVPAYYGLDALAILDGDDGEGLDADFSITKHVVMMWLTCAILLVALLVFLVGFPIIDDFVIGNPPLIKALVFSTILIIGVGSLRGARRAFAVGMFFVIAGIVFSFVAAQTESQPASTSGTTAASRAGTSAQIMAKEGKYTTIRMPSGTPSFISSQVSSLPTKRSVPLGCSVLPPKLSAPSNWPTCPNRCSWWAAGTSGSSWAAQEPAVRWPAPAIPCRVQCRTRWPCGSRLRGS